MKLSISSQCYDRAISRGRIDLFDLFQMGKEFELDGIELEDKHFTSTESAYLKEIKAKAGEANLEIVAVAFDNDYGQASHEAREKAFEKFAKWIGVASSMGIPIMRVFAGWPASSDQSLWDEMVKYLKQACVLARESGTLLALENHNHGGFAKDATNTLEIFKQVDSENLKLCLDTGNYIDGIASIARTAHLAIHVHATPLNYEQSEYLDSREILIDGNPFIDGMSLFDRTRAKLDHRHLGNVVHYSGH